MSYMDWEEFDYKHKRPGRKKVPGHNDTAHIDEVHKDDQIYFKASCCCGWIRRTPDEKLAKLLHAGHLDNQYDLNCRAKKNDWSRHLKFFYKFLDSNPTTDHWVDWSEIETEKEWRGNLIYFLQEQKGPDKYVKIGVSKDPHKRRVSARTYNPRDLEVKQTYRIFSHWVTLEKTVHKAMEEYRVGGEWFSADVMSTKNQNKIIKIILDEASRKRRFNEDDVFEYISKC